MDEESAPIKQIQETKGMIASTLSRCEKIVDYELMELMRRKTDRSTETMPKSVVSRVEEKLLALLHQEPAALVGIEEEIEWIKTELRGIEYGDGNEFTAELGDVGDMTKSVASRAIEKLTALLMMSKILSTTSY